MSITAFIHARIDEKEAIAFAATPGPWSMASGCDSDQVVMDTPATASHRAEYEVVVWDASNDDNRAHIVDNDPIFMLAWCAIMRRVLEEAWAEYLAIAVEYCGCPYQEEYEAQNEFPKIVGLLASLFRNHPDFQKDWLP